MVVAHTTSYPEFKTLVPALLGSGADVTVLCRDGGAINTGCTIVAFGLASQLAIRCTQLSKPLTLATDFPKVKFVTDVMLI